MPVYRRCGKCGKKILQSSKCECTKASARDYKKKVRENKENIKYSKFYDSPHWKRMSKYIRIKYNGLCLYCLVKFKITTIADVVHHIIELKEDFSKRLEDENLLPLCHSCHNKLHKNYTEIEKKELYKIKDKYEEEYL